MTQSMIISSFFYIYVSKTLGKAQVMEIGSGIRGFILVGELFSFFHCWKNNCFRGVIGKYGVEFGITSFIY